MNKPYPNNKNMNRLLTALLLLCLAISGATAQTYRQVNNVSYTKKTDAYSAERLKLDIYYPEGQTGCPVVVWFHGGGLEEGSKEIPAKLKEKGYVVVGANYRLLPKVTAKETIDDAAEAVAWVFNHIGEYGGDVKKIVDLLKEEIQATKDNKPDHSDGVATVGE